MYLLNFPTVYSWVSYGIETVTYQWSWIKIMLSTWWQWSVVEDVRWHGSESITDEDVSTSYFTLDCKFQYSFMHILSFCLLKTYSQTLIFPIIIDMYYLDTLLIYFVNAISLCSCGMATWTNTHLCQALCCLWLTDSRKLI